MKRQIPFNKVPIDYTSLLEDLVNAWVKDQGDNIISIFIIGSYARGEATAASDIDIWVILKHLDFEVLNALGTTSKRLSMLYQNIRINPQCFSLYEATQRHFEHWIEGPVKILDAAIIYGEDLFCGDVNIEVIKSIYKKYLVDIIMGIRHYIAEDAPMEKLTHNRLNVNILKPLLFSLRMERYCKTGQYPVSNKELIESYATTKCIPESDHVSNREADPDMGGQDIVELIEYSLYHEKLTLSIATDHKAVLKKMHDAVMGLL